MDLGNRIKRYEQTFALRGLKRMPLIIRVDGRAFHSLSLCKPFDSKFMRAMVDSARYVAKDMQGFKAAYIQSDEATFYITDYDKLNTDGWFDYNISKVVSISAAMMSVFFNKVFPGDRLSVFDSRAFTVPKDDVVNTFLWRAKDWERNSLQMYARSFFLHKEMQGKKQSEIHEMLHTKGRNWATDLTSQERNGTFLVKTDLGIIEKTDILPTFQSIDYCIGRYVQ